MNLLLQAACFALGVALYQLAKLLLLAYLRDHQ